MFSLHTVRTENPHTPQPHPSASKFHKYHSDIPQTPSRHPTDIPQTPPDISRDHDMPTDAEGLCQTYSNNSCQCLGVSGGVCFCLLASVGMLCYLEMPWGCLGDVWGVSEGYMSGIHRNWRLSDAFGGYVGSQSLQYGAKMLFRHSLEGHNFCHLTILRH